jgi:hypothetical protein
LRNGEAIRDLPDLGAPFPPIHGREGPQWKVLSRQGIIDSAC